MRVIAIIFATVVAASPQPWADAAEVQATVTAMSSALPSISAAPSKNATKTKGQHNKHHEHTPVFKKTCNCAKPLMPAGQLNANEQCHFKFYQDMTCYEQTQGGCPSPVLKC
ncbi:hypothetical protein CC80DRAFT_497440 [Byssothecium circinans]|uniref:Uncharacterized protein n=1 Tax=Byssothecium circinans TaxID=147558 RepID=A0A6A5TBJ8_9PLEO|nr:hypothetical protein CC80DRAFT_497440 [Byssothecium circinans]